MVGGYAKGEEEKEREKRRMREIHVGKKPQVVFPSDQQVKRDLIFGTMTEDSKLLNTRHFRQMPRSVLQIEILFIFSGSRHDAYKKYCTTTCI